LFEEKIQKIVEERVETIIDEIRSAVIAEIYCEFSRQDEVKILSKEIQDLYSITERLETKLNVQNDGIIITNVNSVEEIKLICDNESSAIQEEIKNIVDEHVEFSFEKIGKTAGRMNVLTQSPAGIKMKSPSLENKLRRAMKEKYGSVIQNLEDKRKKYFMKPNKTYIQRKKGQCIYELVEKLKSESGQAIFHGNMDKFF